MLMTICLCTARGGASTVAAEQLLQSERSVRSILEQVEGVLLGGRSFDPTESTRQFVVGLSDFATFVLLPRLTARLDREAPDVSLVIRNTSRSVGLPMLDDGAIELIAGNFPQLRHLQVSMTGNPSGYVDAGSPRKD
ncbi:MULTISPECIES: hypothetical protein [unclassified Mesorhizobium]|uniref:hypothetical protein n=1 Tax=unclassified Mesorhizobium TaxID=325217 RepID=UPI0033370D92